MRNAIAIVGDVHIAPIPNKRLDDYLTTGLNKITQIANECKYVVFLGDMFSTPKIDGRDLNPLVSTLMYLKHVNGNEFFSIIGNHDVPNEDENKIYGTSLENLAASTAVQLILPDKPASINIGNKTYNFHTIPVRFNRVKAFLQNKTYSCTDTQEDILLIHHEYETGTNQITYNDIKDLGCKRVFFGHDHCPLPEGRIMYPGLTVYRSGSLMRNRADDYNLTRQIYYYILDNDEISCKAINHKPASDVFEADAYEKLEYHKKQYVKRLDAIIDKYKNNVTTQQKFSMKNILLEINTPDKCIKRLETKYAQHGEKFE